VQDFPALFRYLSRATHSPWIVVVAAVILVLFVRAVANKLFAKAADWAADFIGRLLGQIFRVVGRLLGRIFRVKAPGHELSLTPAQLLAKAIYDQLDEERTSLNLEAPQPLPVNWQRDPRNSDSTAATGTGQDIANVYSEIWTRRLVILGPAGSGKSVLVQRLALDILGEQPERKDYPKPENKDRPKLSAQIPVIFGLHAWEPGTEFDEWLTSQLMGLRYSPLLTKDLAAELVKSRRILPILDGLDEITPSLRPKLLKSLNSKSKRPLILTSRTEEYTTSPHRDKGKNGSHVVLSDSAVIRLAALSPDDVGDYLLALPLALDPPGEHAPSAEQDCPASAGDDCPAGETVTSAWAPVVAALLGDAPPGVTQQAVTSLREALKAPLMVAIARDIYAEGGTPADLLDENFASTEDAERYLLENFVPAIYVGALGDRASWAPEQRKQMDKAERPFRYLAAHLQGPEDERRQDIAWWELGGTDMTSAVKRALLCGLAAGLVMLAANGTATFAAVLGVGGLGITPRQGIVVVLGNSTTIAVAFGLMHWLAAWRAMISRSGSGPAVPGPSGSTKIVCESVPAPPSWAPGSDEKGSARQVAAGSAPTLRGPEEAGAGPGGAAAAGEVGSGTPGGNRRADWVIQPSWVGLSIPWLRGNRTVGNRGLAGEWGFGFAGGSIGGGVAILGLLLSSLLVSAIGGGPSAASVTTASPGWPATLLAGLGMTLTFGVTAGNVAVLQAPVKIDSAGGPLELLAADRRLALGGGAVAGVLSGAAIGSLIGLEQGPIVGLGFAAVGCATVWLGGAISVTAWGQWLIRGRLLLPLKGDLPWRTRAFLRDAHQRGVLRQAGAFYQFRHSLLQELYAPAKDAPPAQKAP
jgi:hypothetical protein